MWQYFSNSRELPRGDKLFHPSHLSFKNGHVLGGCFLQSLAEAFAQIVCKGRRHSIANLAMLVVHIAIESEAVREALHQRAPGLSQALLQTDYASYEIQIKLHRL